MTEVSRVDHDMWRQCISRDPRVKQNTYAVAMAFAMYGNYSDGTDVYPSMATIAEMVGFSNATKVHPHRKKLVECGYLSDTGTRSAADTVIYCLTAPAEVVAAVQTEREARRKPAKGLLRTATAVPEQSDASPDERPSMAPSGPIELTLAQKSWFLGQSDPESWPWPEIPYATAEHAYRAYTGQIAA